MKQMTEQDIVEWYQTNPDQNFLAFAVTPWHAHGVDSTINMLSQKGKKLKGLIVIYPHAESGIAVSKEHFTMLDKGDFTFAVFRFQKNKHGTLSQIRYLLSREMGDREIYFAKAWHPNCYLSAQLSQKNSNARIHHIIFDEGLSNYMYDFSSTLKWNLKAPMSNLKTLVRMLRYIKDHIVFERIIKKRHSYFSMMLFDPSTSPITPNKIAISYYREIIAGVAQKLKINHPEVFAGSVLISSQPYYDAGQVNDDEDLRVWEKFAEQCHSAGLKVMLKPHPREKSLERLTRLGIVVWDEQNCSQEALLMALGENRPRMIAGFTSTALVTAKIFLNIPAVSLARLVDQTKFAETPQYDMRMFQKKFSHIVDIPDNDAALQAVLCEFGGE